MCYRVFVLASRQTFLTILCGEYYFLVHLSVSILNKNSHYSKTIYTTELKFLTFVNCDHKMSVVKV